MTAHRAIEAYYTPGQVALLLGYSAKWVLERVKAGDFGSGCVYAGQDYRVPASGVNAWLDTHKVRSVEPIVARSVGELRRKINREAA